MAASIFHGAPGSFKSASAVWNELIPALREGRIVVTNIEGLLTKETIEKELGETFPESSDIWRLSSQTDNGLYLWQRWFWWVPVKAFIILDEVQDVFPNDAKVIKPEELDSKGIHILKDKLPEKFYNESIRIHKEFTPEMGEGLQDDTGQTILDENGLVIYPRKMREANMRHRKYGWDIIYCTPVIAEVHKLVRSVCEFAYYHKYNKSLEIIPYFQRRPRIHEHHPTSSGLPRKKDDTTKWRFIPLEVHKCYSSTSTGVISQKRGLNVLKNPVLLINASVLFFAIVYLIYIFGFQNSDNETGLLPKTQTQNTNQKVYSDWGETNPFPDIPNDNKTSAKKSIPLNLPYNAQQAYFNGYQTVILNQQKKYREYFFTLVQNDRKIAISDEVLLSFGIKVKYVNECAALLFSSNKEKMVYCEPSYVDERPTNSAQQPRKPLVKNPLSS